MIMAEAQQNPLRLGGYNDEFVEEIDDDCVCPICTLPLKEAVQTKPCGHRFCKACIDSHFARQETDGQQLTCPGCRSNLNRELDMFEDQAADRKIRSFTIRCPRRSRGCQWKGELRAKKDHLASCSHEVVSCTNKNCNVKLERKGLRDHVFTKCDWRTLRCKFCSVSHPVLQMEAHREVCPKFPLTCPQKCGMILLRETIDKHNENQCALVEISCPFSKLGCPEKFQRKEKMRHLQSCMQVHLDLACKALTDKQEEVKKLENRIDALENRIYTWKIGGFEEILRLAKIGNNVWIDSDPFYTRECGYKFRMRLYPNGCAEGEKTHLSLSLVNIEGEYDAILQWPFPKEVTLILIDQQEKLDDRQTVSRPLTGTEETWRLRPKKGEETYSGLFKFVSHDELQKRSYIVEDTIFIQAKFK
ncbi:TNF receptor-associated factor 4-like [Acropora palmata]|uniref:TNF receptor-associated factor 4-like n=1 Tax=Acropora palmata TaxID=6131 RepID=UPI003DA0C80E